MTTKQFFENLVGIPDFGKSKLEIMDDAEVLTRGFDPLRTEILLTELPELLKDWKLNRNIARERAEYDEAYKEYEERLRIWEGQFENCYTLDWPCPQEPPPFSPSPCCGCNHVETPRLYKFAVDLLKRKLAETRIVADTVPVAPPLNAKELPAELDNDMAKAYFKKASQAGLMEEGFKWKSNKKELALFADLMSEKLKIKNKWGVFGKLFNMVNLANAWYRAKEIDGSFGANQKVIEELFK